MTKEKSLDTIRIYNKKHNIPRCMIPFLDALELIKEVDRIGIGNYRKIKNSESTLEIKGYDELTSSYKIKIQHNKFSQTFFIEVPTNKKNMFEIKLENYLKD